MVKAESVQVCNYPSSPCSQGTAASFYRPRGGGLQSSRTVLIYVWWYDVQRHGGDGRPDESCSWRDVAASPVPLQERLRGWRCGSFSFGHRPYAGSRVRLTEGRMMPNNGRGDVSSSWAPTTLGMAPQYSGWQYSGGFGRIGPELVEETRSTSPMSWCCPVRARGRRPYPFRGFRRPPSRGAASRPYGSGRHSVMEFTPAFPHSSPTAPRMAARGGLAEQRRDAIPRR
jgi:hypothetical protein